MNDIWFFICNFTRTLTITHPQATGKPEIWSRTYHVETKKTI